MDGALAPGWRFAAHLGVSSPDAPLLAATAGSIDPVDQIACAATAGFAGISDNGLKGRPPDVQRRMGKALRDHGLAMGSFTHAMPGREPPFFWGSPVADVGAALHETLAAAERVEGGLINVILLDSGAPPGEQIARASENLGRAAEIASGRGFRIALEAVSRARVPDVLVETVADVVRLIRDAGAPRLGLILDSCHCYCAGDDMAAAILAHADILASVQIADMPGRVEPGAGGIAFAPVMAALARIGWKGLVEAEFDPARTGRKGEQEALAALRRLSLLSSVDPGCGR